MLGGTRGEGAHRVCRTKSGSLRLGLAIPETFLLRADEVIE
jgi:hypothetical protein